MIFALIKNGIVENAIVSDADFAASLTAHYDAVIQIDELDPRPGPGWAYADGIFTDPNPTEISPEPPPP